MNFIDKDRIFPVGPFEINPTAKGNEGQFLNHSHYPNCQVISSFKGLAN
jgi:SET domain-containing protein